MARTPALFVDHGAPTRALQTDATTEALRSLGDQLRFGAVVVISAHGEATGPIRVAAAERNETLHDFGGFAPELYDLRYDPLGRPRAAARHRQGDPR